MIFNLAAYSQRLEVDTLTWFEKSQELETPNYIQTLDYCKMLSTNFRQVNISYIGKSALGLDIPILIIDKNGFSNPHLIRAKNRAVVLIQAGVHPGEPEGKDAMLMMIRDMMLYGKNVNILDNVSIVFLPIFNVDGHERRSPYNRINQDGPKEMGWRTTAQNYNLNRDYLKADAVEMKLWIDMFNRWNFDFLFDCHTTNGADYQYPVTYSLELFGNLDKSLTNWAEKKYLPHIETKMEEDGYPIFPYVIFRNWHDPQSGLRNYVSSLKLLNGYAAANNRISLLIETHQLKSYSKRVWGTYRILEHSLDYISKNHNELMNLNKSADENSRNLIINSPMFPLKYAPTGDSIMVDFKGVFYEEMQSEFTNSTWFKYDSTRPLTYSIPFFKDLKVVEHSKMPVAYVVPQEWLFVEPLLKLHKIDYYTLRENINLEIMQQSFENVKLSATSFEGRQMVESFDMKEKSIQKIVLKNSLIIPVQQIKSRLVMHLFEPKSDDSFLQWGYFNIIFEQKEYTEAYVIEKMLPQFFADNPNIKAEFDEKMKDEEFASNTRAIHNWIYSQTPYWDENLNDYPILKIMDYSEYSKLENAKLLRKSILR